ncbi:hypothetical protein AAC387_Pa04g0823 [Persea americana]
MAFCTASQGNSICNLGNDVLMNILSRLPPKSLTICKCVSKTFRLLVSTLIHSPTRPRPMSGLFVGMVNLRKGCIEAFDYFRRIDDEIVDIHDVIEMDDSISFLPCPDIQIVDCHNGFLRCSSNNIGDLDKYYVCNPVTRQWVALPQSPKPKPSDSSSFHDAKFALVLDESSDVLFTHFKVVEFVVVHGENSKDEDEDPLDVDIDYSEDEDEDPLDDLYVYVYSSQTGQWAESKAYLKGVNLTLLKKPPVFLNGVLFLLADPSQVLMFHVEEEYCGVLDLPIDLGILWFFQSNCLGESEECLRFAHHNGLEMGVWVLDDMDSSEWVLVHKISFADIEFPGPLADSDFVTKDPMDILAFHPNSDAIFLRY